MDDGMLLDALFVTIAVLCLPIGFGRGVIREAFVSAGFLFGALLASSWARPWGIDVAESLDINVGTGQFIVSTGFVVGAALLFGYGGAAAAHIPQPRRWTRLTGAVLAVCNGALIIGLILRDIERFLADGDAIRQREDRSHFRLAVDRFDGSRLEAGEVMEQNVARMRPRAGY